MARFISCLMVLCLAFHAAGKVVHKEDLLNALEHIEKDSTGQRLNRYDLDSNHEDDEDDLELPDDSKAAVVLSDDASAILHMRDGGDDGNLIESVARDTAAAGHHASDGGRAVMSKRGRASVRHSSQRDSRAFGGDGNEGGVPEVTEPQERDPASERRAHKRDVAIPPTDGNAIDNIININTKAGVDEKFAEGDIVAPPTSKDSPKRDATTNQNLKWPKAGNFVILPYITTGLNENAVAALNGAIDNIQRISCVRIVPRVGETDYVNVKTDSGCWSPIGKVGNKQDLSLGAGCEHVRIATHELYHALGFWHEQSRRDRDKYITIYWDKIPADKTHNFNMYGEGQADYLGQPYDGKSIMHYGNYAFSVDGSKTINWIADNNYVLSGDTLSSIDIAQLNALYACNRHCDAFPRSTASIVNTEVLRDQLVEGLRLLNGNGNDVLARRFWDYIAQCQYPNYYATVAVYADVTGYEYHAFIGYDVSYAFRTHAHNFVVYTKPFTSGVPTSAEQDAVLAEVVAAITDKGCHAQTSRDRAWAIASPKKARFVHVVRHGYGVNGYHSLANTKWANYKCGNHCSFWLLGCSDIYEFVYIGF